MLLRLRQLQARLALRSASAQFGPAGHIYCCASAIASKLALLSSSA